jgi:hypothetical protein
MQEMQRQEPALEETRNSKVSLSIFYFTVGIKSLILVVAALIPPIGFRWVSTL